jgi:DNA-binding MarR family transcriptional regulator
VGRAILHDAGLEPLTPARFDLLYVVHEASHGFIPQKELTVRLGLHPSTVSKMLTRLEELGLASREYSPDDGRERDVYLTPAGRELISRAIAEVFGEGYTVLVVDRGIAPLHWWNARQCLRRIRRTNGTLRRYALALHDTAAPLYAPAVA